MSLSSASTASRNLDLWLDSVIPPGLSIIHANHSEDLRDLVLMHLARNPLRPLENEVFLVQSNGMAQWLRLRFAADDGGGIAAALDMQMPSRFLWQAYRAVLGEAEVPQESSLDKARLSWRLLRLLPDCLADDRFGALRHYLADPADVSKRFQLAERLADLFDQYQVYRADWLEDWGQGRDVLRDARGREQVLPHKLLWQPELWRRVLADLPAREQGSSRALLHQRFLTELRTRKDLPEGLPRRLVVFGLSSLPQQVLEALEALSRVCQVLICVNNPCRYYWADIIEERQLLRFTHHRHLARPELAGLDADSLHAQVNPLLAAWGKQGRDYIGLLYGYDQARQSTDQIDLFRDRLTPERPCLLHHIQQGILELTPVPQDPADRVPVAADDDSVRFNLAYSRQREVEILQDHLLDLFNREGSDLQPRDIIVMVPDISAYAPHIEAVFGRLERDDLRHIPYTIADRPERSYNPLLIALEHLLGLPESRFTASDLLDLLDIEAFRDRFGLRAEDLPTLHNWIRASGIRWGLHAMHRAGLELPETIEQNSWRFGLRRMLLGYASGRVAWAEIEPFDELGGLEAAIAGRLARVLEVLDQYWRELSQPRSAAAWAELLGRLVDDCLEPSSSDEVLLLDRFSDLLGEWREACEQAALIDDLPLSIVRDTLMANFDDGGLSQRFLAGMVNFCTLMPMRAIPFRVVCLLGMNDADYPRQRPPLDFDLMAEQYRPGDRTRREDDRYLFLEALLAARDQLYISYIGRSERDNSERTPSVLVGQLREHIAAGWQGDAGRPLLDQLTLVHPLQPFSPAYFVPDRDPRLFSYAREWRGVHEARACGVEASLPPWQPEEPLTFDALQRFMRQPAELFFRERLNVWLRQDNPVADDHEPFVLDRLTEHGLRNELVEQALRVAPEERDQVLEQCVQRFVRRGLLPLGAQVERIGQALLTPARDLLTQWDRAQALWPEVVEPQELRLTLEPGAAPVKLEDWLAELHRGPDGKLVRLERRASQIYSGKSGKKAQIKQHYFLGLWLRHLAASAAGIELKSVLVAPENLYQLAPKAPGEALEHLTAIAAAWQEGLCYSVPLALRTAFAWLDHQGEDAGVMPGQVADVYDGGYYAGESQDSLALQRCWPTAEALWGESGADFRRLARLVYEPLHHALQTLEVLE